MSDNPYTIVLKAEEKELYTNFAKKHGYNTLSRLIRKSLEVVMQNPSLLEVTESRETTEILESLQESVGVFDSLTKYLESINERLESMERFQEWTVKKLGASEKDLKEIQRQDLSGEAIFE